MACSRGKKIVNMLSLNALTTASTCENIAEDIQGRFKVKTLAQTID